MYNYGDLYTIIQQINWQTQKIHELENIIKNLEQNKDTDSLSFEKITERVCAYQEELQLQYNEPINQLQTKLQHLQSEISLLKTNRPVVVEKMEYKFDQLKVEKLEGTLNIGVTPNHLGSIEGLSLNDKVIEDVPIQPQHSRFLQIKTQIEHYLKNQLPKEINLMQRRYRYKIDNEFRTYIINDIRKQAEQRIHHYLLEIDEEERYRQEFCVS